MSHNANTINSIEPTDTGDFPGVSANQVILIGAGASNDYSNSPATGMVANSLIYLYDTSPTNTISGAVISSSSGWIGSVSLPAGTYHVQAATHVVFSASGDLVYSIALGGTNYGPYGRIGAIVTSSYSAGGIASAYFTLSSTTSLTFKIVSSTNVAAVASQGNTPSQYGWMTIRKEI